jgi:signal transduction histidine kinase
VIGTPYEETGTPERRVRSDAVQRDRARLGVLAEIGLLLSSSDDYVTILHKVTEIAVPALGDWCAVHVVEAGGGLERVAIRHVDPGKLDLMRAARVVESGRSESTDAQLAVPLVVRGNVIGVLTLGRVEVGPSYDRDDVSFAEELARRVAMYVDNALLLREVAAREAALRDEASRLETLNRIGQQLAAIHDLDEVVQKVCDAATALTGAGIGVYFTHADGVSHYAVSGATPDEATAIARRQGELAPAFALRRSLRVDDVRRAANPPNLGVLAGLTRVISYLAVPVRSRRGDIIGGIALGHPRAGAFDSRAEQLVIGLASMTATATDSARLFREAHELIAALEKSNRDLDQFAYVTSHDLRAPLRGIANLATWIEEDLGERLTERGREHLGLLRGRVQRLEDLIQGVLDYSRAGRVADPPVDVDVGALVREVVELLAPPAHVSIRIAPNLPRLRSTRAPLQQVFMNLIANAITHNDRPDAVIEIGAEPRAAAWELYVRDNGPGIAPRYHAQIWGLFQKLASRDKHASTGIGLALVRKVVEAHGGRAWVESVEGKGATFRFTWPKDPPLPRRW